MLKRFIPLAICGPLIALSSCTWAERQAWLRWHAEDPEAAVEFASQLPPQQAPEPEQQAPARSSGGGTVWDRLAQCESGGNWQINTGNGYYGGLQFLPSTWRANGGSGLPHQHSREEQIRVAENLREDAGFAPWPACSRRLGLR